MADDDRDEDEIDREAVLGRRRKLLALALASLTSLTGASACGPTACLSIMADRDGGPDAGDAGPDGGGDGGPSDAAADR